MLGAARDRAGDDDESDAVLTLGPREHLAEDAFLVHPVDRTRRPAAVRSRPPRVREASVCWNGEVGSIERSVPARVPA